MVGSGQRARRDRRREGGEAREQSGIDDAGGRRGHAAGGVLGQDDSARPPDERELGGVELVAVIVDVRAAGPEVHVAGRQ